MHTVQMRVLSPAASVKFSSKDRQAAAKLNAAAQQVSIAFVKELLRLDTDEEARLAKQVLISATRPLSLLPGTKNTTPLRTDLVAAKDTVMPEIYQHFQSVQSGNNFYRNIVKNRSALNKFKAETRRIRQSAQ